MKKLFVFLALFPMTAMSAEIRLKGGANSPLSEFSVEGVGSEKDGRPWLSLGGDLFFPVKDTFHVGVSGMFVSRSSNESRSILPTADLRTTGYTTAALLSAKINLSTGTKTVPYIVGGVGVSVSNTDVFISPKPGFQWTDTATTEERAFIRDTTVSPAFNIGAGISFPFGNQKKFFFEVGYFKTSSMDIEISPVFGGGSVSHSYENMTFQVGIEFSSLR